MRITLEEASQRLLQGEVIAVPTETVYGLAASLARPHAIDTIFALKKRPAQNPLIIHIHDSSLIKKYSTVELPGLIALTTAFWPGPLTIVLPVDSGTIPEKARAGLPTAAFRMPKHPLALKLLQATGPLVMPSANLSGRPSSTHPEHVEEDFGGDFPVLDGGVCSFGLESTIVIYRDDKWQIIRQGALSAEALQPVLGYFPQVWKNEGPTPICPGQMFRHYAPKAKLILESQATLCKGVIVGFKDRHYPSADKVFYLGNSKDALSVAENLYAVLRQLDQEGVAMAHVDIEVPCNGLWLTILERLHKAAEKE